MRRDKNKKSIIVLDKNNCFLEFGVDNGQIQMCFTAYEGSVKEGRLTALVPFYVEPSALVALIENLALDSWIPQQGNGLGEREYSHIHNIDRGFVGTTIERIVPPSNRCRRCIWHHKHKAHMLCRQSTCKFSEKDDSSVYAPFTQRA